MAVIWLTALMVAGIVATLLGFEMAGRRLRQYVSDAQAAAAQAAATLSTVRSEIMLLTEALTKSAASTMEGRISPVVWRLDGRDELVQRLDALSTDFQGLKDEFTTQGARRDAILADICQQLAVIQQGHDDLHVKHAALSAQTGDLATKTQAALARHTEAATHPFGRVK